MPKKSTPKNRSSSSFRNFIVKHSWSIVGIGLIVALILTIIAFFAFLKFDAASEKKQFKMTKEDMLTLQSRLNAQDDGQWKYAEGCSRSGGGFQATHRYCGLGLNREFKNLNQPQLNEAATRTTTLFNNAAQGLFMSKTNFSLPIPQLNNMRYSELSNEYLAGENGRVRSTKPHNSIECSYIYDLKASAPVSTGELRISLSCGESTITTYFDLPDVSPESSRHKAESPL